MITLAGESITNPDVRVYLDIVTGTHGSGKSTLIDSFADQELTAELGLTETHRSPYIPHYSAGLLPVHIRNKDYEMLVVTCEEPARRYVTGLNRPELVTTGYSLAHQVMMDSLSQVMLTEAMTTVRHEAVKRPPIANLGHCGLVLADRSAIDGLTYSTVRFPNEEQALLDSGSIEKEVMGFEMSQGGKRIFRRNLYASFIKLHSDLVFICDERDVAFSGDELRLPSTEFRNSIRQALQAQYAKHVPERPLRQLSGSTEARHEKIRLWTERLLTVDDELYGETIAG